MLDAQITIENEDYPVMASEIHRVCRHLRIEDTYEVMHWHDPS
jgi:hypothetical protein